MASCISPTQSRCIVNPAIIAEVDLNIPVRKTLPLLHHNNVMKPTVESSRIPVQTFYIKSPNSTKTRYTAKTDTNVENSDGKTL